MSVDIVAKAAFHHCTQGCVGNRLKERSVIVCYEYCDTRDSMAARKTPIPCTDIPKLERKEDSGNKTNLVRMGMFIPEETNTSAKLDIIKILKKQFNFSLNQTKEYVDSCIGKYSTLPNIILQTEVDEVTKKLEPYNVIVSTAMFY